MCWQSGEERRWTPRELRTSLQEKEWASPRGTHLPHLAVPVELTEAVASRSV